jgi:hypothetical protein
MNAKISTDKIAVFAAGFIATAFLASGTSGLLQSFGMTTARVLSSVGIEAALAVAGGLVSVFVNSATSKLN